MGAGSLKVCLSSALRDVSESVQAVLRCWKGTPVWQRVSGSRPRWSYRTPPTCLLGGPPSHTPRPGTSAFASWAVPLFALPAVLGPHLCSCARRVGGLTPVPLGSSRAGSHRGSPLLCWSSRSCRGSWRTSTRWRHGRRWRTGRRRSLRGRRTCNPPACCSRKRSRTRWDWSIRSRLGRE